MQDRPLRSEKEHTIVVLGQKNLEQDGQDPREFSTNK